MITCGWCNTHYQTWRSKCDACGGPMPPSPGQELGPPPPEVPRDLPSGYAFRTRFSNLAVLLGIGFTGFFGLKNGQWLLSGNAYSGIGMAAAAGASIYGNVTDNTFSGDFTESVIHVTSYDEDALIDTNITGNTLLGNVTDYAFLWLLAYSTSNVRATVANNSIRAEASLGDGFAYLYAQDSGNITVEGFDNNALLGTADYYLWLDNSGTGSVQVDGTLSAPFSNAAPALNTSDINVFGTASGKIFFNGAEFDFANP